MKRMVIFLAAFAAWLLLVWPFEFGPAGLTGYNIQDVIAGLAAALLVVIVMRDFNDKEFRFSLNPIRWFWALAYVIVLAYYIVKANFDVAYRVLHPAMPIRPGIVKVRTTLKSADAITVLANSITLTPGTLTINADADGTLYVHWINVTATDTDEATAAIVSRFEWFLKRIFE
jgi:multicomponent Na+:H+ antiporter subunit E